MAPGGRPYQLVIFGASGFTGQFVVEEVARAADGADFRDQELRWAVAGRSKKKLQEVLDKAAQRLARPQLKAIDILICDVGDAGSLAEMAKKASVVLDCVGPGNSLQPKITLRDYFQKTVATSTSLVHLESWRFYGEPVVKACVENGTHFIDISGERLYLESMHMKYNSQAAEKGVYVIGSSGFDSIPADMGVLFTRKSLQGTLTAVESFLSFKAGPEGACLHEGTWQSAIYGIADQGNLKKLRKQLALKPLPVVGKKIRRRGAVFYSNEMKQYSIPFLGSDASVVGRTQRYLHENLEETPVQYGAYIAVGGLLFIIQLIFAGFLFMLFTKFSFGRKLLINYPKLFSFGYFSKEGPTQKQKQYHSKKPAHPAPNGSLGTWRPPGKPCATKEYIEGLLPENCTHVNKPGKPCATKELIEGLLPEKCAYMNKPGMPRKLEMEDTSFSFTFFGEGYSQDQDIQQGKPNLKICTQVSGPEPAYVATPIAMVQAGVTILKEPESLPKSGGVYTPGAAFSKTKLIERLDKAGIHFTVISKTEV